MSHQCNCQRIISRTWAIPCRARYCLPTVRAPAQALARVPAVAWDPAKVRDLDREKVAARAAGFSTWAGESALHGWFIRLILSSPRKRAKRSTRERAR